MKHRPIGGDCDRQRPTPSFPQGAVSVGIHGPELAAFSLPEPYLQTAVAGTDLRNGHTPLAGVDKQKPAIDGAHLHLVCRRKDRAAQSSSSRERVWQMTGSIIFLGNSGRSSGS